MLAPVTHILPVTTIRRERLLPLKGKVLARKGQKVGATDTLAETNLTPEHLLLDLARGMGMPADKVDGFIHCKAGDQVDEGDILVGPVGFTRRLIRSPRRGRVVVAGGGQILIEIQGQPFELKAGMPGTVVDLVADRGVVIETTGALIQGVWGNGGIDFGLMYVLASEAGQILTADRLDVSLRGAIVLGGHCETAEVLKTASSLPLRGLILASLNPDLIPLATRTSIPVVVIEGFGVQTMNSAAFKLLSTSERREVALNAEPWDAYAGTRPEVVIPLPASGEPPLPKDTDTFTAGQTVRVIKAPYMGIIGTLVDLGGTTQLPSGLRALTAEVRLENGESATLPLANLEVLE
ncbi:MAG TPA: hypothetical protein VF823_05690 [Anaerolineales bacterium]